MSDIVERLRLMNSISGFANPFAREAADEIERLRDEVARLQRSLDAISSVDAMAARNVESLRAEVERLRAGGCARDQRLTQWCAEAEAMRAENAKLREALRRVAIVGYELGVGTWCRCCHEWWLSAAPEKHKPGCLAAQEGER